MEWDLKPRRFTDQDVSDVLSIFRRGFGIEPKWRPEDVKVAAERSSVCGFLLDDAKHPVGYAFFSMPDEPLDDTHLLWEDAVCLDNEFQARGLAGSHRLWPTVCNFRPGRIFGWIGGRTQNPAVVRRYQTVCGDQRIYPFH